MKHELKIEQKYLYRILKNEKQFEIRENDRDYQVGDTIKFLPLAENDGDPKFEIYSLRDDGIPEYLIHYIHSGYGLLPGIVIMSIRQVTIVSQSE